MRSALFLAFTILFLHLNLHLFGQDHADCKSALHLEGLEVKVNSVKGYGSNLEIKGNDLGNKMYFTEEHNTVWIRFDIPYDGEMTLDIIPESPADDWDFMLYKMNASSCEDVLSKKIIPVRGNLARNDPKTKGVTGLRKSAVQPFEPAGVHPNFSKFIEVTEKEQYMLIIDINENQGKGFNLVIDVAPFLPEAPIETPKTPSRASEFVDMTEPKDILKKVRIQFEVLHMETKKPVPCSIEIVGADWTDSTLQFDSKSKIEAEIPADAWFYVNVTKDGYTFSSEKFKSTPELASVVQKIYINEVKQGSRIVLTEIVFRENTTHLLPTSINALEQLITFMKDYPTAVVEIQGHVNAPGLDNDGKVKKFSLKRAEQIKEYLVDAGIDAGRVKVRGMGNEHMIYKNPVNYDQEKANRRVEIEILSY